MWELDHKESWVPKNWCFWTVVLEKTLENPVDYNCGVGEDSWEPCGLQGDQTSQSLRKSTLNIHWKDWCWSQHCNTLAIWCEELAIGNDPDVGKDWKVKVKVTQSCLTLCNPWTMEFSRPEYWSGHPFPSPGNLPNPGIEVGSPALQVDSLPAEPQGKSKNTGVGSLSLL